jgi:hypothetical protein
LERIDELVQNPVRAVRICNQAGGRTQNGFWKPKSVSMGNLRIPEVVLRDRSTRGNRVREERKLAPCIEPLIELRIRAAHMLLIASEDDAIMPRIKPADSHRACKSNAPIFIRPTTRSFFVPDPQGFWLEFMNRDAKKGSECEIAPKHTSPDGYGILRNDCSSKEVSLKEAQDGPWTERESGIDHGSGTGHR